MGKGKKKREKKYEKNRLNAEIRKRLNEQNREQEPEQLAPQEIQSSDEGTTTDTDGELSLVSRSDKGRDVDTLQERRSAIPKNPDESVSSVQIVSPDTVRYKPRLKDNKTSIAPASLFDPKGHCKSLSEMHPSKKEHQSLIDSNASIQSECESTVTGFAEAESNPSDLSKSHNETKEIYERHTSAGNSFDRPTNALKILDSPGPLNFQADYFSNNQRDISESTANHGNIAKSSNSKENAPECSIRQSRHSEILGKETHPSDTSDSETEWDKIPDVKELPKYDYDSYEIISDKETNPTDISDSKIDETEVYKPPDVKKFPEDDDDSFEVISDKETNPTDISDSKIDETEVCKPPDVKKFPEDDNDSFEVISDNEIDETEVYKPPDVKEFPEDDDDSFEML